MNFASFGFAPQMLLASLESVQFVTNVFFGRYFMGRTITWTMYVQRTTRSVRRITYNL